MAPKYELLPTEPPYNPSSPSSASSSSSYLPPYESEYSPFNSDLEDAPLRRPRRRDSIPAFDSDPRFRVRTPSPWARAALLLFMFFLFWLAFHMRRALWIAGGAGMGKEPEPVDPSY
ncbi:hypothetical protein NLJ89_g9127 [Agrocybe chaxingu]|uniref:Uncharacterized protein n=1 Tax=Agrocybe chaxingu TaxID=84603 RepID=A0A9W8MTU7_9AGAR|nr:hypothetical protein NLJ89_g9127 [Agrocybe chaxingu]